MQAPAFLSFELPTSGRRALVFCPHPRPISPIRKNFRTPLEEIPACSDLIHRPPIVGTLRAKITSMNCSMHHLSATALHLDCPRAAVRMQAVSSWQISQVTTTKRASTARQEVE
jgi:hypothetical protein